MAFAVAPGVLPGNTPTVTPTSPGVPPFRLFLANTITGQVAAELSIGRQPPTWQRVINSAGSLSAQIPLTPRLDSDTLSMLSEPWKWTLCYSYGNAILQAAMLVDVDVDDSQQPPTAQLTTTTIWDFFTKKRLVQYAGQTLTSTAANVVFASNSPDPANQNLSWGSVAARLVQIATNNGNPSYSLPIVLPTPTTGTATITYTATDLGYVGQRLTEITQQDGGPEIEFSPEWVDSTHSYIQWRMRVGQPRLGNLGYPHAYDYQVGALETLKVTLDGQSMTFDETAKGQDNRSTAGGTLTWAEATDATYTSQGWPALQTANTSHSSETNTSVVQAYATGDVNTNRVPIYSATATVRVDGRSILGQPTGSPTVEAIQVGDTAQVQIQGHLLLADGLYGARILSIGNGRDQWTAAGQVQLLGVAQ